MDPSASFPCSPPCWIVINLQRWLMFTVVMTVTRDSVAVSREILKIVREPTSHQGGKHPSGTYHMFPEELAIGSELVSGVGSNLM